MTVTWSWTTWRICCAHPQSFFASDGQHQSERRQTTSLSLQNPASGHQRPPRTPNSGHHLPGRSQPPGSGHQVQNPPRSGNRVQDYPRSGHQSGNQSSQRGRAHLREVLRGGHTLQFPRSSSTNIVPLTYYSGDGGEGVDDLHALVLSIKQGQEHIRGVLHRQEIKQNSIESALKQMMEKQHKTSFCLKAANLELPLRKEMAKLFCQTMDRYPKQEHITAAIINGVLSREQRTSFVAEKVLKEGTGFLSTFRTEERRRVLGIKPQEEACTQLTPQLASSFMHYMKAPGDDSALKAKYSQHLEEVCSNHCQSIGNQKLHQHFVKWIARTYPFGILQEDWDVIDHEDRDHPYNTHPLCEMWYGNHENPGSASPNSVPNVTNEEVTYTQSSIEENTHA